MHVEISLKLTELMSDTNIANNCTASGPLSEFF